MTLSAQQNLVWVTGCKHFHFSPKMFHFLHEQVR